MKRKQKVNWRILQSALARDLEQFGGNWSAFGRFHDLKTTKGLKEFLKYKEEEQLQLPKLSLENFLFLVYLLDGEELGNKAEIFNK